MWANSPRRGMSGLRHYLASDQNRRIKELRDSRHGSIRSMEFSVELGMDISLEIEVEPTEWSTELFEYSETPVQRADDGASCFSRLLFLWFYPLLRKGMRHDLDHADLGKEMECWVWLKMDGWVCRKV